MTANTLLIIGLGELDEGDVLHWLKSVLARDLAAMRVPKSEGERVETLAYALRRLDVGRVHVKASLESELYDCASYGEKYGWCMRRILGCGDGMAEHGDRYYDQDGELMVKQRS